MKNYFIAYHSLLQAIDPLNDSERGRLFTACLQYSMTGEAADLRGNEKFVFSSIKSQIDSDNEKYEKRCQINRDNIKARWHTNVYDRIRPYTNEYERIRMEKENEREEEKEERSKEEKEEAKAKEKGAYIRARAIPPTLDEVRGYCAERHNSVDPERFYGHYESNGWMVGKVKMKDWKAAVRTWERSDYGPQKKTDSGNPFLDMLRGGMFDEEGNFKDDD